MENSPGAETRRSTRLSISIPIVIHGKDAHQKTFKEKTHTLIVNKHGAKLVTSHQLAIGMQILIENPSMGSSGKANVVWVTAKSNSQGLHEVGVQLVEAQNIWGLEFPPDDWTAQEKDQGTPAANGTPATRQQDVGSPPAKTSPSGLASAAKPASATRPAPVEIPSTQTSGPSSVSVAKPASATRPAPVEIPSTQTSGPSSVSVAKPASATRPAPVEILQAQASPSGSASVAKPASVTRPAPVEILPAQASPSGSASVAKPASVTRPAPVEIPPAQAFRPGSTSEEIATQFLQDLHETTDAHARKFRERLDEVVEQVGLQLEIDLRGRVGAAKEEEFAAMEQQFWPPVSA